MVSDRRQEVQQLLLLFNSDSLGVTAEYFHVKVVVARFLVNCGLARVSLAEHLDGDTTVLGKSKSSKAVARQENRTTQLTKFLGPANM